MKLNASTRLCIAVFFLSIGSSLGQVELPASWAYPSADKGADAGFMGKVVQARKNAGLTATIARGNAHLNGTLLDGGTEMPYPNLVIDSANPVAANGDWTGTTPVDVGGGFTVSGPINFSADGAGITVEDGNFSDVVGRLADAFFPGLPGGSDDSFDALDNGQNFSIELLTYLELPAGEITLGVYHDDAMELALHPNDARDLFRQQFVGFDSNSGSTDRTVTVNVAEAGLYSARILMAQWNGNAALKFDTQSADETRTLINNTSNTSSINAWQSITTGGRPYVTSVARAKFI